MKLKTQMQLVLVIALSHFVMACAQSLPDGLDQKSVDLQSNSANLVAPLDLVATMYNLEVGSQATLAVNGGTAPYTFAVTGSGAGTLVNMVFTATAVGNVGITVTDSVGATSYVRILIVAATVAVTNPVVTNPVVTNPVVNMPVVLPTTTITPNQNGLNTAGVAAYKVYSNAEADTVPLYSCFETSPVFTYYNGTIGNCPNRGGIVGYIYPTQKPGTVALHRFKATRLQGNAISGGLVIYYVSTEGTAAPYPYTDNGIMGYVPQ